MKNDPCCDLLEELFPDTPHDCKSAGGGFGKQLSEQIKNNLVRGPGNENGTNIPQLIGGYVGGGYCCSHGGGNGGKPIDPPPVQASFDGSTFLLLFGLLIGVVAIKKFFKRFEQ